MSDAHEGMPPPDDAAFGTRDRIMAVVLLAGSLALAYVCLDVIADGRLTAALLPHRRGGEPQ